METAARFCGACGKATAPTESGTFQKLKEGPDMIGREIAGRYRIQSKLGEGGMGAVFKAEQISLKRTCAIKLLRPDVASSTLLLRRFNAEAEAVAKLSHPNTVNIYDFGQDTDGTLFIAMEFVEGRSLREVVQGDAPLTLRRALSIAAQVCASLVDAHAQGIIHRDLKPDNVMLQDRGRQKDVVRVLDFGIAKLRDDDRATQNAMTQAGDMLGTPQYMAPEQIRAEQIDGRTDVYALGCMLYEMITGRLPFEAPTIMALLSKHLIEVPPPPSQRRPDLGLPPALDDLVMTAMAKEVTARPPTMEAFGEQIAAYLHSLPIDSAMGTAQRSAVIGVGYQTAPTGFGQPPSFAPPPPPQGFAPTAPPPSAAPYPGPVTPRPMTPPGYAAAQPVGGYAPPAYRPPPPTKPGSGMMIFIIIGVVVVGALTATVLLINRSSTKPTIDAGTSTTDDAEVDEPDDPALAATTDLPGTSVDIAGGARFIVPPGFTHQRSDNGVIAFDARGIMIAAGPLESKATDIQGMAAEYETSTSSKLEGLANQVIQGASRPMGSFVGELNGVKVRHIVALFSGSGYALVLSIIVPIALTTDDAVKRLADEIAEKRLVLPGANP
ncbi:MAG: serine/threonine-protein kinase [Kofleriaceae bacterium]